MKTMQPLSFGREPAAPVFIHLTCLEVVTWTPEEEKEYGPINTQGCDRCDGGPDGQWTRVYVEREKP